MPAFPKEDIKSIHGAFSMEQVKDIKDDDMLNIYVGIESFLQYDIYSLEHECYGDFFPSFLAECHDTGQL